MSRLKTSWGVAHRSHRRTRASHPYIANSPHGRLAQYNVFVDTLQNSNTVHLLHITTALDTILAAGSLQTSGGCLVGSLYCTSIHETPRGLRAHNLGSYIYRHEIAMSLKHKNITGKMMSPLIIEVQVPSDMARSHQGVDYLSLGEIHLETFRHLAGMLPASIRTQLTDTVLKNTLRNQAFWHMCAEVGLRGAPIPSESYFAALCTAIRSTPILGYLYFEAATEYIMLHSNDAHTAALADRGEINCWAYKTFAYKAQPQLFRSFNLGTFNPSLHTIKSVVKDMQQIGQLRIDVDTFLANVQWRISNLAITRLMGGRSLDTYGGLSFESLAAHVPHLAGNGIDRAIRNSAAYADFSYLFDKYKAEAIWEYWNEQGVLFPYNAIVPKGEVGINPAIAVPHRIYKAKAFMEGNDLYLEKEAELPLQVVPSFLHAKHAFMGLTARMS